MKNVILGGMMGHCVGDALGVPFEYVSREILKTNPVSDMQGYGVHNQPPGTWSDDTSLSLCLAVALTNGLDYDYIMEKYIQWFDEGFYTPYGDVFDFGETTRRALIDYDKTKNSANCGCSEERNNGSGSLKRILPLLFYLRSNYGQNFLENEMAMDIIHKISSLTHAHPRSHIACGMYLTIASQLIDNPDKEDALTSGAAKAMAYYSSHKTYRLESDFFNKISGQSFSKKTSDQIASNGYVVDTLESAVWAFSNTRSYKDCVLQAVNLGGATDTIAAVAGGLAGIFYGYEQIPEEWLVQIAKRDMIEKIMIDFSDSLEKT